MANKRRELFRDAYRESLSSVRGGTATLATICLSLVILNSVDDQVIFGNAVVATPVVGQTRYRLFIVLAPLVITAIRAYIDLQVCHLARLASVIRRNGIRPPLVPNPVSSPLLWIAGAVFIHLAPAISIATIGYHASAVYPEWGLALYGWATLLLLWSVIYGLVFFDRSPRILGFTAASGAAIAAFLVAALPLNREKPDCERRFGERPSGASTDVLARLTDLAGRLSTTVSRTSDLERSQLAGGSFGGANFVCAQLDVVDLSDTDLRDARFRHASLYETDLARSRFQYADFNFAVIDAAEFSEAEGAFSFFRDANISDSGFRRAHLMRVEFHRSQLSEARFAGANLRLAVLTGTDITSSDFSRADLRNAKFIADARRAPAMAVPAVAAAAQGGDGSREDFNVIWDTSFKGARLSNANFLRARLTEVDFRFAELDRASFRRAVLDDVDFGDADLTCANFSDARLVRADFSGVPVDSLATASFSGAEIGDAVIWPDGFDPRAPTQGDDPCL